MKGALLALSLVFLSVPSQAQEQSFDNSWRYYKWRIEQGDSLKDLERVLMRLQARHAASPEAQAPLRREMTAVQALLQLAAEDSPASPRLSRPPPELINQ